MSAYQHVLLLVSSPLMRGCFFAPDTRFTTRCVFPAHAGVFLIGVHDHRHRTGLPRSCGGVSCLLSILVFHSRSSPLMRGCFHTRATRRVCRPVFPAHAGVFPHIDRSKTFKKSLPRSCGGVSTDFVLKMAAEESSPLMRGCFSLDVRQRSGPGVFPAHAGVFPQVPYPRAVRSSLPRSCGGVSKGGSQKTYLPKSSPLMRGCFYRGDVKLLLDRVFPAHAGVFRPRCSPLCTTSSLPRSCGGVSGEIRHCSPGSWSSPLMRGCFYVLHTLNSYVIVFPAHAGVFLGAAMRHGADMGLPRSCGGVSISRYRFFTPAKSSPLMRGCFSRRVSWVKQ